MDILNVENLSYKIDGKIIIDDISFSIRQKSINAVLSSNKSGKTTLIKLLSGIIYDGSGKITVNNITLNRKNFKKYILKISTILDDIDHELLCETVEEEIKYPLINLKYIKKDIQNNYDYIVNLLSINDITDKYISELNEYEKIKVVIASSIIHKPKLLLIDDLFRFLNESQRQDILNLFKLINERLNITILFTTSSLEDVKSLDNIIVLNNGKLVLKDSYDNLILQDNELSKIGIEIPLMVDLSRKLQFYNLIDKVYYNPDEVVNELWK